MRECKRQFAAPAFVGLLLALTIVGWTGPARAEASAYELCIEHSPARSGTVTPDTGTHRFSPNSVVTLSADPQPGYQFAYWIGDVSDPKSQTTTVHLNTSKIVVAVFKPVSDEEFDKRISIGGGGGGGLAPTRVDLSSPSFSVSGGGGGVKKVAVPVIVTPEPATALLLSLGALGLRRRRQ